MSSIYGNDADGSSATVPQGMNATMVGLYTATRVKTKFEDLQQHLYQAQRIISRLEGAQEVIVTQNDELKKENDQLRLQVAQAQSEEWDNAAPMVQQSGEELLTTQRAPNPQQMHKRQAYSRQTSGQRTDSSKEEVKSSPNEHNAKRRHGVISGQERVQSRSKAVEFLNKLQDKLFDDLSGAHEPGPAAEKRKRRAHLEEFASFAEPRQWFCFRDVCENGQRAIGFTFRRVCPAHGQGCGIIIRSGDNKFGYDIFASTFEEMQRRND
ncbi:Ff.00g061640.m01.CDS01 [Fusarium sp. VM40]|nr:Ff.00g061640.m01.CDS01 [Fusarium sp. VM40]